MSLCLEMFARQSRPTIPRLVAIAVYLNTAVTFVMVYCFAGDKLIEEVAGWEWDPSQN